MKIKHWMTPNPIWVRPSLPVMEASRLMKEKGIRRLPVVDDGKVVGMITHRLLLESGPSQATTLSVHELNYILANLTVGEVMHKDPICVSPEDSVLEVVRTGHQKGIGGFPVVEDDRLVGIVTEGEIFNAMFELLGGHDPSTKVIIVENVRLRERVGAMSRIASVVEGLGVPLLAQFSLRHRNQPGNRLFLQVETDDPGKVAAALKEAGYKLGD